MPSLFAQGGGRGDRTRQIQSVRFYIWSDNAARKPVLCTASSVLRTVLFLSRNDKIAREAINNANRSKILTTVYISQQSDASEWKVVEDDGDMKVYIREAEMDGVTCDPIKATTGNGFLSVTIYIYSHGL